MLMQTINNKYTKWYNNIISNAKTRILLESVYTEKHHIIPRSLGGSDDKNNKVVLTAKEHFICHLLLCKMTKGKAKASMCYAVIQMTMINTRERYVPTSRIYEMLKKQISEATKGKNYNERYTMERAIEIKNKIGEKSKGRKPFLGRKHSEETKKKISLAKQGVSTPKSEAMKLKLSNTRKAMKLDFSGEKNPMYGKKQSTKTKELISKANSGEKNGIYKKYKNLPKISCPHCGMIGKDGPNFIRWHLDNCKRKN